MNFIQKVKKKIADFIAGIYQFPVETILCLFAFAMVVAMYELDERDVLEDSYFYKQFAPVSLIYVVPVFSIAFAIRSGLMQRTQHVMVKIIYWLSALLVLIPQFFFKYDEFGKNFWFGPFSILGIYLLSILLIFIIKWQKDNHLFVRDAYKLISSFVIAAMLSAVVSMAYYAIAASVFYLFLPDYVKWNFLVCRVLLGYVGFFILIVLMPLIFCHCAKNDDEKTENFVPKALEMAITMILTPALVCYAFILILYAAKIVAVWSLPRGNVAWMVMAFLIIAFLVNMLQPFLPKTRFSFFFKYFPLPLVSVVPLALFWVGIVRRISDYGLTESRVFLLTFGVLMTLFIAFTLSKRLNSYLLMSGLTAVAVFFLTLVPPTSALSLSVESQKKRLEEFLAKYPIYDVSTKKVVSESDIPAECLRDTVARKQFVSALRFLNGVDTTYVSIYHFPFSIRNFDRSNNYKFKHFVCPGNVPIAGYSYLYFANEFRDESIIRFKVGGRTVLKNDEDAYLKKYHHVIIESLEQNTSLPEEMFCLKNDSVLVVLESLNVTYYPEDETIELHTRIGAILSNKPLSAK